MTHGADNRAIAEELHISYATVRTHVRSILAKLGARLPTPASSPRSPIDLATPERDLSPGLWPRLVDRSNARIKAAPYPCDAPPRDSQA
jgi:hypothetical protein